MSGGEIGAAAAPGNPRSAARTTPKVIAVGEGTEDGQDL